MRTGIIDVGGGLRGIYATGVLDRCMDLGTRFELAIGVSAGSANLASFLAGQRGRNYVYYTEYAFRKEYMSVGNYLKKRTLIDLDYVYTTLSAPDGEYPLDFDAFHSNPTEFYAVATDAKTGMPYYFGKDRVSPEDTSIFKASSAIPTVCHPWEVDGIPCFDGALSDPIPLEKAFTLGCDRVVLVLTKPKLTLRTSERDRRLAAGIRSRWPRSAEKLCRRARVYNSCVAKAMELEKQGAVLIVAPDDTCGVDTLTRDRDALRRLYEKGYADGNAIPAFLEKN